MGNIETTIIRVLFLLKIMIGNLRNTWLGNTVTIFVIQQIH